MLAPSRASVMSLAACSSALDGMQPTCRQVPPGRLAGVDERDLHALVGGEERRGVAAGTAAEDDQLRFDDFGHESILRDEAEKNGRRAVTVYLRFRRLNVAFDALKTAKRLRQLPGEANAAGSPSSNSVSA